MRMSCESVTSLVTDYLEGRLAFWERARFQLHIGMCPHCRRYLRQMRRTIATLGRLPPEPIPEATMDELLRRFRGWEA